MTTAIVEAQTDEGVHGLPVTPHGGGAPTYHFVISTGNARRVEFVDIFARGGSPWLKGEPRPGAGFIELGDAAGFGYAPDQEVLSGRRPAALIC